MSRGMEQALESLIPLYSTPLPRELIDLARSLLAQSRNSASNLKPEEEVARTYVCANIACERLKRNLNLPKIQPKPPIPPRNYKKLYEYFDKLLAIRRREPAVSTPSKTQVSSTGRNTPRTKSNVDTPEKGANTSTTPVARLPPRSSGRRKGLLIDSTEKAIPGWIRPLINALCISLESPGAAPHVLAGVTTILTVPSPASLSSDRRRSHSAVTEDKKDKIPALISAVFILVATKLNGDSTSSSEFVVWRKEVGRHLKEVKEELRLGKGAGWEWERYEDLTGKDVDAWMNEINEKRWMDLDWFLNIEKGAGVDGEGVIPNLDVDREGEVGGEGEVNGVGVLRMGLGSMVQDSVDFLSEKRRAEYAVWREGVMRRIREIEAEDGEDDDVDMEDA